MKSIRLGMAIALGVCAIGLAVKAVADGKRMREITENQKEMMASDEFEETK